MVPHPAQVTKAGGFPWAPAWGPSLQGRCIVGGGLLHIEALLDETRSTQRFTKFDLAFN